MQKRLRVYRTFLTGVLIGLFYVVLISEKSTNAFQFPDWILVHQLIDQKVFVLVFSGILGGVLYTIMVDGKVELPRFVDEEASSFEAGLFGDILLGIAGALIVGLFTTENANILEQTTLLLAAKGIIGGYGSKALMSMALQRFISRVDKLEAEKEAVEEQRATLEEEVIQLQTERQDLWQGAQLMEQINQQVEYGIPKETLIHLQQSIEHASIPVKKQIFGVVKEFRRLGSRSEAMRDRVQRMIPLFEALAKSDPKNHQYHAQLAYAHKDAAQPDLEQALTHLNQAIDLRGAFDTASTWKYDLNRAIVRMHKTLAKTGSLISDPTTRDAIVSDLLNVTKATGLKNALAEAKTHQIETPIVPWLQQNRPSLEQQPHSKTLLSSVLAGLPHAIFSSPDSLGTSALALPDTESRFLRKLRALSQNITDFTDNESDPDLPPLRSPATLELLKNTLLQHVRIATPVKSLPPEATTAIRIGLGYLGLLDASDKSDAALTDAWQNFKQGAQAMTAEMIDPASVHLLLKTLDTNLDFSASGELRSPSSSGALSKLGMDYTDYNDQVRQPTAPSVLFETWSDIDSTSAATPLTGTLPAFPPTQPHPIPTQSHPISSRASADRSLLLNNCSFLGRCYNILKLDPLNTSGTAEDQTLFDFSASQATLIPDSSNAS